MHLYLVCDTINQFNMKLYSEALRSNAKKPIVRNDDPINNFSRPVTRNETKFNSTNNFKRPVTRSEEPKSNSTNNVRRSVKRSEESKFNSTNNVKIAKKLVTEDEKTKFNSNSDISRPATGSEGSKFNIIELQGDLFSDAPKNSSLAHCVSADFRMGKGIASIFKEKFQGVDELLSQKKGVGEVAFLHRNDRHIFYIITKEKYFQKPSRQNFERSLHYLRRLCEELGVKALSIPRIGSGLDRLPPEFVQKTILKVFDGSNLSLTIFYL